MSPGLQDSQTADLLSLTISKIQTHQLHMRQQLEEQQLAQEGVRHSVSPAPGKDIQAWVPHRPANLATLQTPRQVQLNMHQTAQRVAQKEPSLKENMILNHSPRVPISGRKKKAPAVSSSRNNAATDDRHMDSVSSKGRSMQRKHDLVTRTAEPVLNTAQSPSATAIGGSLAAAVESRLAAVSMMRNRAIEALSGQQREQQAAIDALNELLETLLQERAVLQQRIASLERSVAEERNSSKSLEVQLEVFKQEGVDIISRLRDSLANMTEHYRHEVGINWGLSERLQRLFDPSEFAPRTSERAVAAGPSPPHPAELTAIPHATIDQFRIRSVSEATLAQENKDANPITVSESSFLRMPQERQQQRDGSAAARDESVTQNMATPRSSLPHAEKMPAIPSAAKKAESARFVREQSQSRHLDDGYESPDSDIPPASEAETQDDHPAVAIQAAELLEASARIEVPQKPVNRPNKPQSPPLTWTPDKKEPIRGVSPQRVYPRSPRTSTPSFTSSLALDTATTMASSDEDDISRLVAEMNNAIAACEQEVATGIDVAQ